VQGHVEHDGQPYGGEAQRFTYRRDERNHDEDHGDVRDEHAQEEHDEHDESKGSPLAARGREQQLREVVPAAERHEDALEHRRSDAGEDDHHRCFEGPGGGGLQGLELELAIGECNERCCDRPHRCRLRGRCDSGIDDAQDGEDENEQRQCGGREHLALERNRRDTLLGRHHRGCLRVLDAAHDDVGDVQRREQEPRHERAHEQLADGDAGDRAVDDEQDARRNEDAERAAGADDAATERLVVASPDHCRQRHDGQHDRRPGYDAETRRQQRTDDDGGNGDAAPQAAEDVVHGAEELLADSRLLDHRSHEDEQRDGEQDVVRGKPVHLVVERGERLRTPEEEARAAADAAQHPGDRKTGEHAQENERETDEGEYSCAYIEHRLPPSFSLVWSAAGRRGMPDSAVMPSPPSVA